MARDLSPTEQGYRATLYRKARLQDNPYQYETSEWFEWVDGYYLAKQTMQDIEEYERLFGPMDPTPAWRRHQHLMQAYVIRASEAQHAQA